MKKKVFSLMMMLLLAVTGFVRANELTVHDGTTTNSYVPVYGFYADSYLKCEMVYPASELTAMDGGTISELKFYASNSSVSWGSASFQVFLTEVGNTTISAFNGPGTVVYTGALSIVNGEMVVSFTTPYTYNGGNLLVGVYNTVEGTYVSSSWYGESVTGASVQGYSYTSLSDISASQRNFLPKTTFTYSGGAGGGSFVDNLHIKYMEGADEIIDSLNLGVRPAGCWMEPFPFTMYSEGPNYTVNVLDFTPSDGMFEIGGVETPFQVTRTAAVDMNVSTTNRASVGVIERQFVAITEGNRAAHIWPIVVDMYQPYCPDVWELAYDLDVEENGGNPLQPGFVFGDNEGEDVYSILAAHTPEGEPVELHNDYHLPFPEIEDGEDAVFKFSVDQDVIINAYANSQENDKVALYTEDFYGEGGPMATNNYTGLSVSGNGGGAAGAPYEAQVGDGTSTTGYLPMYYLYNYSLSTQLYLGTELAAAGATTAPMSSIAWFSNSTYAYNIQNISIWMANVNDTEVSSTSPLGSGMTLVYNGDFQEVVGWNEFVFNGGSFAWDGHSNVLVMTQMNNGSWSSSIQWQCGNVGFTAGSYVYQDNTPYSAATTSYAMSTTTNRANTMFKSVGRGDRDRDIVEIGDGTGTTYYFPIDNFFNYSCTEQIYTADEIGTAGTINSISFYYNYGTAYTANNVTMYMKNVSRSEFASNDDCEPLSLSDIVWTGSIAPTAAGWYTFTLDTPFQYNGTDNLLVAFFDGTSGYPGTSYTWRQTTSPNSANMALRYYSDSATPDPYNLSSYNGSKARYTYRANVQIDITPGGGGNGGNTALNVSAGPVIENLPLTPGTYYLVTSAAMNGYPIHMDIQEMPCPAIDAEGFAFNPQPADDEDLVEPASVTLRWMVPEYATGWRLIFGSTYHPEPGHPQTIMYPEDGSFTRDMANSYTVRNLWNNTNYFWRVEFNNDGCPEGVSSPVWGFTTHLNVPQNLTAVDETVFNDEQIVLNWTAVVDRTYRMYNVYRDGELIGHTNMNDINNSTYTDGPLSYQMGGYTYYVTAVYDEGESAPSNEVTVKVSGYGDVNGHVYQQDGVTGIANATVTMIGQDEFGVSHTYNFTTNAQGYYSGHIYVGTYNGQAAKNGYQTIYEPVQGNPIGIVYNETTSPIDYILDENFDPVCAVLAEYYPDATNPESEYVKVSWGCGPGLPGWEIVEDFETGDFSMYDWQVSPTYPWTVTTNDPYEGQYCMKSGGAGVANVVSDMEVTVEIPNDGVMSFFAKISCENSWDYGYFYIDGVQKGSFTGQSNWVEKTYDITAGNHTFKWSYTKDSSVNSNDDCFYVDYIHFFRQPEPAIPGMTYDFEDGTMQGWTSVDADGDGYGWFMGSEIMTGQTGNNGSNDFVLSQSYYMGSVLYPDNYLVSPQVQLGGIVRFYACAQDASYAAEHFGLAVSTTNTNPSSFTMVQEWTMTAKGGGELNGKPVRDSRSGRAQGNWYEFTVDLSAYSGNGYVAIRHFNCSDMFYLNVDDITIGEPGKGLPTDLTRDLHHYRVYRTNCYNDGPYDTENTVLLASVWVPDTVYIDVEWSELPAGVYKWGVGAVYEGNHTERGEEEIEGPISWSEPVSVNNGERATLTYDFDDNTMAGWTSIDADGDGNGWVSSSNPGIYHNSGVNLSGTGHNASEAYVISGSYANGLSQALTPDNYLVSPQIALGGSITFYACAQDASWAAEHFGVAVSTTSNTSASAFTTIQEWTMTAKGVGAMSYGRDGNNRAQGNWYQYTVDLTGFTGMGYVAIRHFNCTDQFILNVDDITIVEGAGGVNPPGPTPGPGTSNGLQLERESEIVWSNCLDKDMWLDGVTVNVELNSADNPEGTTVDFTNLNPVEQMNHPVAQVVLDSTGFHRFNTFRRGEYLVQVRHEGYEPIDDTVLIWENTNLRYVMIEILYGVDNIYVSRTGWAMWDDSHNNPGGNPGGGGGGQGGGTGNGDTFDENFDSGMPAGWTTVDADGDGLTWVSSMNPGVYHNSGVNLSGTGHNSSEAYVISGSYANQTGQALHPDNYLVSPRVNLANGSTFSFWACAQDASYAAEHFGVAISDNGTSDWTMVNEWTMTAKGTGAMSYGRDGNNRAQGNWYQYTVDLSSFAGQKYIGIRHFNCTDMFILNVDDITLTNGAKSEQMDRHFEYYKVMCTSIDNVPIFNHNTVHPFCQLTTDALYNELVEGDHYLVRVASVYSTGQSAWSEPVEWEYEPCDHWGPVDEVTVNTLNQGNHIEWVFDHGYNPYGGQGGGGGQGGTGDTFSVDFESGMPAGWTVIDGNNDGYTWCLTSAIPSTWTYYAGMSLDWYHNGSNAICSGSYINGVGAVNPDEYLVSPQVNIANGSQLNFWAAATDAGYPADHFGVFVSDDMNNWTSVQEWTLTGKKSGVAGGSASRDGRGQRIGTWYNYNVDLSNYAGQKYIAFRHFNCYDQYIMCLDDIELTAGAKGGQSFAKGGEFYSQYAEDGVMLNFFAFDNVNLRVYMLYKLSNDSRFSLVPENEYGQFILNSTSINGDFMDEFETVYRNAMADFNLLSKVDIDNRIAEWKSNVSSVDLTSVMMDVLLGNARVDNDQCINSLPFCTSETITFEAANTSNTANEPGMDDGCIGLSYNPSFYHMRIHTGGPFVIHMEGHDPDNGTNRDIDFCMWGPYTEQEVTSGTACSSLTGDKIMDCCYSTSYSEDCYLGYAEGNHQHPGTGHGTINYHMPEVGEYYILMITNYSQQPCVINFTKTEGEGETDCNIVTNPDIIGFLITQDGEYLAFAGPDDREYTDLGEFGEHEYCVRPIYPGDMILPDQNYGWSMGCPVCASTNGGGQITCEMEDLIHVEDLHATDQVKLWWGVEPAAPISEWLYYDDGVYATSVGAGGTLYWGTMFPAAAMAPYAGTSLTKVALCTSYACTATLNVYVGGNMPGGSPAATQTFTMVGDNDFMEITLNNPVPLDGTQNLWITFYQSGETYPADACADTGDANNRWVSIDGSDWLDLSTAGLPGYGWMIRGFVTNQAKGGELVALPEFKGNVGGELSHTEVVSRPVDLSFMNRATVDHYNVYRSTDNVNYGDPIQSVAYVAGQTYYEYVDTPAAGTYYYQVTAVYDDGCESAPASAFDNPNQNYVVGTVTGMGENDGNVALYPNPTKGNVTIEANGMSRITVVSVLGQVVFDTELNADNYTLNMSQFNAGMYMVRIHTAEGVTVKRVTVMQ